MVHKLADNWRCHVIPSAGSIDPDGQMDLTKMAEGGALTDGRHYLQVGGFRKLTGEATGINPIFLTLTEFNERNIPLITFTGTLVFEHPDRRRMVLVGTRHFNSVGFEAGAALADQQDSVWILTKP